MSILLFLMTDMYNFHMNFHVTVNNDFEVKGQVNIVLEVDIYSMAHKSGCCNQMKCEEIVCQRVFSSPRLPLILFCLVYGAETKRAWLYE